MIEDDLTPQQRAELGDLPPLYKRLDAYDIPEPDHDRLLAALKPVLAQHRETAQPHVRAPERLGWREWLRLAWAQIELLEAPFWGASVLLTLIGLVLGMSYGSATTTLCLFFLSPLIAVGGVAYIFRPATRTLWELERLSRYQPFELLYARVAIILLLNVATAIILLLVVWSQGAQIVLWRLLLIWLGPMIGLMGLALFCSLRWSVLAGMLAPMSAWSLLIVLGWREIVLHTFDAERLVTLIGGSNLLLAVAVTALVGGLALVVESGRQVERWRS
ncbi:MAG: hypothetical protein IT319_22760 [Anaerolineae bacterium]|nr:hypothetical protein [Anaerolineae bacterium]